MKYLFGIISLGALIWAVLCAIFNAPASAALALSLASGIASLFLKP